MFVTHHLWDRPLSVQTLPTASSPHIDFGAESGGRVTVFLTDARLAELRDAIDAYLTTPKQEAA